MSNRQLVFFVASLSFLFCGPSKVLGVGEAEYNSFNSFCLENFGAEHEELTYEAHGGQLVLNESEFWIYESENSVSIGFSTSLPAKTHIQYGLTNALDLESPNTERFFYNHLHQIASLQPNSEYFFRVVAEDERGNFIFSEMQSMQTAPIPNAVHIPGDLGGPPFDLDQDNTTYVLTQDIMAERRAFSILASGVVLDLNGHTVQYDNGIPNISGDWSDYAYSSTSTFGVHGIYGVSGKILNGRIAQGENNSSGDIGIGFNPIFLYPHQGFNFEVAGVVMEYAGDSVGGLIIRGGNSNIHHNVIIDKGTGVLNRHQGVRALYFTGDDGSIQNNLIKRSRHQGIVANANCIMNEVYIDSWATNSYGMIPSPNRTLDGNKIFGTGYHNCAIGAAKDTDYLRIQNNFIHLQGDAPNNRSDEYGPHSSVNGIRLTQYSGETAQFNGYIYDNNVVVVKVRNGTSVARGIQFFSDPYVSGLTFQNNTVKTEVLDSATTSPVACVVAQGLSERSGTQLPIFYRNNKFLSNSMMVSFGDSYGAGGNHIFEDCRFEKFGSRNDFATISVGYWNYNSIGNSFLDCETAGGAALTDNFFNGTSAGALDYSVGHHLYIRALTLDGGLIADTDISPYDSEGAGFIGHSNELGIAKIYLLDFKYSSPDGVNSLQYIDHTDHEIRVAGMAPFTLGPEILMIHDNIGSPVDCIFSSTNEFPGPPQGSRWIDQ